ncbi:MAG TPA: DNA methyltransferase [Bellilinea sp.]|nr:DNA methyltransferase [Bellilinea sp.]
MNGNQQITHIPTGDVVYREDLYIRVKPSPEKIQEYAENLELLPPIEVNQHNILIDGYHRWIAHRKAQADTVPAIVTETASERELERLSWVRNRHGLPPSNDDKRAFVLRHYDGKNKEALAAEVSVSLRTIARWTENKDRQLKEDRDQKIREMWLACHTQEEIAEQVGMSQQTVAEAAKELPKLDTWQKAVISAATYAEPDWSPPLYNIWSFAAKSNKTGHFGNTEQTIVDRLLYMYTQPFDIVVDPFGGGGSTIDVCKHRLRRYWVSDRLPIVERTDIRQHDILDGPPPLHKRWQDVSLMYLDPPYWRQAQGQYSEDDNDLANMPLEQFYDVLTGFVTATADKMRSGSHIALIIQPTQWLADDRAYPADHVFDLVNLMRANQKLRYQTRIICPYQTEQYNPQQVEWAKANRQVLTLNRELIVWSVA